MIVTDTQQTSIQPDEMSIGSFIRTDGLAVLAGAGLTVLVELGTFFWAKSCGVSPAGAMLAALAVSAVWIALASPALAAGGERRMSCWLRGGSVADASAITLIVLWLTVSQMTFLAAVKIYCIYGGMCVAAVGVVTLGRASRSRCALAGLSALVLMVALSSLVWLGGPAGDMEREQAMTFAKWAVRANPFAGVMSALSDTMPRVWSEFPLMYELSSLGDTIPLSPVSWHASLAVFLPMAALCVGAGLIRRR